MTPSVGLRTHIWNNNLKSLALLAGFPVLLVLILYAGVLAAMALGAVSTPGYRPGSEPLSAQLLHAASLLPGLAPWAILGALIWFFIAWLGHQAMIDAATGARGVDRSEEPELYNMLENLCISRGLTMPSLRVIETPGRNAFATGLSTKRASITLTRGLVNALEADEMEAVLAHELTHVRNHDIRLLVIAVIFVGIFSLLAEVGARGLFRGSMTRMGGARRGKSGNAGALILIAIVVIGVAYGLSLVIRFTLSRKREYMADAGAVELTKNPDAMISALRKVSASPEVERAPREMRQMFLHDRSTAFAGLFATHPPIEDRIEALKRYAGGMESV
ncbi:MAG: M48 family metallopeptidase [Pseudomonadota bacterium]